MHQKAFIKKAIFFYSQRLEDGKDEYENFDPCVILEKIKPNNNKKFWEREVKLLLKNGDYNKVKKYLRERKDLYNQVSIKYICYYTCASYPLIYRLYRRIFYYNKT